MNEQDDDSVLATRYPSVQAAYELAVGSYDVALRRIDSIHQRVDILQSIGVTLTGAIVALVASREAAVSFGSASFVAAVAVFGLFLAVGFVARAVGGVVVTSPGELYEGWLDLEPTQFRIRYIYGAGYNFDANLRTIWWKSVSANLMTGLLAAEAVLLGVWAYRGG